MQAGYFQIKSTRRQVWRNAKAIYRRSLKRNVVRTRNKPGDNFFSTRLFKVDFKLVTLNSNDGAVAEFLMENPFAHCVGTNRLHVDYACLAFAGLNHRTLVRAGLHAFPAR